MRFIVTRPGGIQDAEFETYSRLLRWNGLDLGRVARAPDPGDPRRWACVWEDRARAQAFADQLGQQTGQPDWAVQPSVSRPSIGPFGPVSIQLTRGGGDFSFSLQPLSLSLIESAFPAAVPSASLIVVRTGTWATFQKSGGALPVLVRRLLPVLTGLSLAELDEVGYVVEDADESRPWVFVAPAEAAKAA